ncbi:MULTISPECIES: helix-turn-helix domain-containing protein [Protofrankia]|uniref:Transcriptional regulator n=1 Tax=Protofrankia coriariae TaxID=1562887 RepID=A0ABR5F293_9ACTN|nr:MULTISPECIES: transcriptional regulator [Protofrankia]KLL10836.1 transcriptional regulator [Protofrankia coriariae]ONH34043.1 XRE family transcriptional regulator [Protofrankia sp. BMG5.30]
MTDRNTSRVYTARRPVDGEDWAAVAAALNARMAARRIGQQQLAEASGVSVSTVRLVQHGTGRRFQNKTLTALARALDWPDDYLITVLLTGQPPGTPGSADEPVTSTLRRIEDRLIDIDRRLETVEQIIGERDTASENA